jgi:hypothetical protein
MSGRHWRRARVEKPDLVIARQSACRAGWRSGSAFAVIRDAIHQEGMVALGKVVFTSREHVIALEARGKGMNGRDAALSV